MTVRGVVEKILTWSLDGAARQQRLDNMMAKLSSVVPDISAQYSTFRVESEYLRKKVRAMHAFQVSLLDDVMKKIANPVIVDVGDSSGTHLEYIRALYGDKAPARCLSVNMDEKAVARIRKRGLDAICARAEGLLEHDVRADIFLCFEILEHLTDPARFLHSLSASSGARYVVATVPYIRKSRVGLHHIRGGRTKEAACAENTHIFELKPGDWKLLVRHSGWEVAEERIYLQYPRSGILRAAKYLWNRFDFEGFYGLVLEKNDAWSSRYSDW